MISRKEQLLKSSLQNQDSDKPIKPNILHKKTYLDNRDLLKRFCAISVSFLPSFFYAIVHPESLLKRSWSPLEDDLVFEAPVEIFVRKDDGIPYNDL